MLHQCGQHQPTYDCCLFQMKNYYLSYVFMWSYLKKLNMKETPNPNLIYTFAVLSAAPYPVDIPHPSRHTLSKGA